MHGRRSSAAAALSFSGSAQGVRGVSGSIGGQLVFDSDSFGEYRSTASSVFAGTLRFDGTGYGAHPDDYIVSDVAFVRTYQNSVSVLT